MLYIIVLNLMTFCLTSGLADINVTDYICWEKSDIIAWDQYMTRRILETELLTNMATGVATARVATNLSDSLSEVLAFQSQETRTAQIMMQGTDAEGCLTGIINYLPNAIAQEISTYNDCSADATSNIARMYKDLFKMINNYDSAYNRTLSGIDTCAKTYPNKDSIERLKSCVEFMSTSYYTAAKVAQDYVTPSPSMTYFQDVCIGCANNAYNSIVDKGKNFLKMLLNCALLDPNIDQTTYAEQLNQWKIYNNTLSSQISDCQDMSDKQVSRVETDMKTYYSMKKNATEKYLVESRDITFYEKSMYMYLSNHYNAVTAASLDNPGDSSCAVTAISDLNNIVNSSSADSLTCDKEIVADTKIQLSQINGTFFNVSKFIRFIGNVDILACLCLGDFFAPETLIDCFKLTMLQSVLDYDDAYAHIEQNVNTLTKYKSFFEGSDQPCGGTSLKRAYLAADIALYKMQRCIYSTSGTVYFVTTPSTSTTISTTTAQTTSAQTTTTTGGTTVSVSSADVTTARGNTSAIDVVARQ